MKYTVMKMALTATAALLLAAPGARAVGSATAGQSVFQGQCAMCHGVTPGAAGIGPSLAGVYGAPAASTAGYKFSAALTGAHLVWTADALNKFLTAPQSDVPGTKMPYAGLPDSGQRADVIAYLATLKGS